MIELKTKQTGEQAGGAYCSCCGFAIDDGAINTIQYGPKTRLTEFRICGACLNKLHLKIEAVHG